ncbi:YALIA101S08e02828g1_1 [Yarrowia lipolytica]|nr:YALIA101S08e02828g1_1 [Yarrowia lipolytica]
MNVVTLLLYVSTVSAVVVTVTLIETAQAVDSSRAATTKSMTSTSSSSRAQILATGTPPMFASAKNAIISNVRSLKVPSASGYLAKDVEPTQSVTPFTLSSSVSPATTASANPTSAVSVAQTNFVSRTGVSVMFLSLSFVLVTCSIA